MKSVGRNGVYIPGLFLFVLFQMPPVLATNIETIMLFRFFAGAVGSPAMATGGASLGDVFDSRAMPYVVGKSFQPSLRKERQRDRDLEEEHLKFQIFEFKSSRFEPY